MCKIKKNKKKTRSNISCLLSLILSSCLLFQLFIVKADMAKEGGVRLVQSHLVEVKISEAHIICMTPKSHTVSL